MWKELIEFSLIEGPEKENKIYFCAMLRINGSLMIMRKCKIILVLNIITIFLFSCKTEEIILHGDIRGSVTDALTSEPVSSAMIKLNPSDDTAFTGNDGTYLLENITPGEYEIQASKFAYVTGSRDAKVVEAKTGEIRFSLNPIAVPIYSDTILNFGFDLTSLSFTISNAGKVRLAYIFNTSQDWISIYPTYGDVTNENDSISVTIDRSNLSESVPYKGTIRVISDFGTDTIYIAVNGLMYEDQLYKIVKIGTQTWMAENLNAGIELNILYPYPKDDGIIEKFCYSGDAENCQIYGGLYGWHEAMQYNPSDNGTVGTTRGACPGGWHLPTENEWLTMINYLGGDQEAGGKLKETGIIHWLPPNTAATNETGFTALPGGYRDASIHGGEFDNYSFDINSSGTFWTATSPDIDQSRGTHLELSYDKSSIRSIYNTSGAYSVRCVKDQELK
jgi:uncharacterized protein (TIGR02145 family)